MVSLFAAILLVGPVYWMPGIIGKECVAVLIGLYKSDGAILCVGFDFLSDCSLCTADSRPVHWLIHGPNFEHIFKS